MTDRELENGTYSINPEIINMASKIVIECDDDMNQLYPLNRPSSVTIAAALLTVSDCATSAAAS